MQSRAKKIGITLFQGLFTVSVLFWLLRDPKKRHDIHLAVERADQMWLLLGIATYGIVEIVAGFRWDTLLRVQGIALRWTRLWTLLLIGLFFNFFIPGGTGGDVVKIFYLMKEVPGRGTAAFLSVLMDRIVGLFAMILMSAAFIILRWKWLTATPETTSFVWTALTILGVTVLLIVIAAILSGLGLVHRLPSKFPAREKLAEFAMACNLYGSSWRAALIALFSSFISHFGYFFTFYCAAKAFSAPSVIEPTLGQLCTVMPLVNCITALPISIGGLGVREELFQVFLGKLVGVDEGVAILISSTGFLLTAVWGVIGGFLYLVHRPGQNVRIADIEGEIDRMEHQVAEDELVMEASDSAGRS